MSIEFPSVWDEHDIPAVAVTDLKAAITLWLRRERQGLVVVDEGTTTQGTIDRDVLAMLDHPADGLAVLVRMRCLAAVLTARRFRHVVESEHAPSLGRLITVAAGLRLNARWGMSPVRLAWAMAAIEGDAMREAA